MAETTTMTTKGQVTAPKEIRDRRGPKSGDKMAFTILNDGMVVMRLTTWRPADLAGSLTRPGQPRVAIDGMDAFKTAKATSRCTDEHRRRHQRAGAPARARRRSTVRGRAAQRSAFSTRPQPPRSRY